VAQELRNLTLNFVLLHSELSVLSIDRNTARVRIKLHLQRLILVQVAFEQPMVQLDVRQSFLFEIFFAVFLNDKLEEFSLVVRMVHKNARQVFNSDPLIFLEFKPLVLGILKGPMGCIINQSSDYFFDDCHYFIRVGGLDCLTAGISK
jgi:hypothetical protein